MKRQKRLTAGMRFMISAQWTGHPKLLSSDERQSIIHEFTGLLEKWGVAQKEGKGSQTLYSIVGQKADFMLMILRPTMEELNQIELEFNKSRLAEFTIPAYSYVSVVELSNYLASGDGDPYENPHVRARLYPELPESKYVCFYPMDKEDPAMTTGTCFLWKNAET